jgi:hypothetical protein
MNIEEGDTSFPWDNEGGDTSFLNKLNDLLWAEPDPSNEGLGLGWTNTRMLAISEQIIKNTLDDQFLTMSSTDVSTSASTLPTHNPTENPTVLPTEVPSTLPTENPSRSTNGRELTIKHLTQQAVLHAPLQPNTQRDLTMQIVSRLNKIGLRKLQKNFVRLVR